MLNYSGCSEMFMLHFGHAEIICLAALSSVDGVRAEHWYVLSGFGLSRAFEGVYFLGHHCQCHFDGFALCCGDLT